jgi:hypothetical protein
MKKNLYIPQKICIGFQKREDTFTGKLAFIVYWDDKGVLRKEKSFNGWIDKKIPVMEIENKPHSGFMLNKDLTRNCYHFGSGRSVIRVYDPNDFEFEINCSNLISLLANSDCSKSEIVEECVYAWDGTELILLPTNSLEYQESIQFTQKQGNSLSTRDLVKGYSYATKKSNSTFVYIDYTESAIPSYYSTYSFTHNLKTKKRHLFYNIEEQKFVTLESKDLSHCISEIVYDEYAECYEYFNASILCGNQVAETKQRFEVNAVLSIFEKYPMANIYLTKHYITLNKSIGDLSCEEFIKLTDPHWDYRDEDYKKEFIIEAQQKYYDLKSRLQYFEDDKDYIFFMKNTKTNISSCLI